MIKLLRNIAFFMNEGEVSFLSVVADYFCVPNETKTAINKNINILICLNPRESNILVL